MFLCRPLSIGSTPPRTSCFIAILSLFAILLPLVGQKAAQADEIRLLLFGDSLTAGYGLSASDAFPEKLRAGLRAKGLAVGVINSGVSGDTTAAGRSRMAWALGDKPQAVVIELGANDGLRGIDPAHTRANLDTIIARFKSAGVRVLIAGMRAPPNLGREYGAEFNSIFPDLARKHRVALYPFFLEGVVARQDLNQRDGIHPNAAGVQIIVRNILPHVVKLLERRE